MKRIMLGKRIEDYYCAICGEYIHKTIREWVTNDTNEEIAGIAFVTKDGTPAEGYDLCDECIAKLYSKMIY